MDINASRDFMNNHKDQVIDLFLTYQMIETLLFMKLHFPDIPKIDNKKDALEAINKKINSKTLGELKLKYLKKFPHDDYDLKSDLELVTKERNTFMHAFWIFLALWQDKDRATVSVGEQFLEQYENNTSQLLKKIHKLPN